MASTIINAIKISLEWGLQHPNINISTRLEFVHQVQRSRHGNEREDIPITMKENDHDTNRTFLLKIIIPPTLMIDILIYRDLLLLCHIDIQRPMAVVQRDP